ncbi:MAG: di-heme oxidoredictase family protein [Candidatus Sulfotelmatobacter sp.]
MIKTGKLASVLTLVVLFLAGMASAQTDPGVQSGNRATGATLINPANDPNGFYAFFKDGLGRFQEVETVSNSANVGLGPRFNSNQCSSCHAQPAVGGSGAAANPQFQFTRNGVAPGNTTPYFITANGPTLEARFPFFFNNYDTTNTNTSHGRANLKVPNGDVPYGGANLSAPNGGVEDLYTVTGRSDAGSCNLPQPNFSAARAANNIIFRIPTPVFGAGLIENLDDSTLLNNQLVNNNNNLGISGSFNRNGNDGTITRYGWKAQNKSLQIFAGEAYNVEMGVSNELFPQERPSPGEDQQQTGLPTTCLNLAGVGYPEDTSNPTSTPNAAVLDDVSAFANFMRFLAPPPTGAVVLNGQRVSPSMIATGSALFSSIGCAACHNPTPGTTQVSNFVPSLSNAPVPAFSDIEIHHMGTGLADNVSQGNAGGDQFRTAPLWGLGQRIFLLHDGRTTNLITAIQDHASQGSEATFVVEQFFNLPPPQQQEILDFLRSL